MSLSHGTYTLTDGQMQFVRKCVGRWLSMRPGSDPPTPADVDHSALLTRLLSGQEPFEKAPPRAYSYPWYELLELGRFEGSCSVNIHQDGQPWLIGGPVMVLCQAVWRIVSQDGDRYEIEWPPTELRATLTIGAGHVGEFKDVVIEVHQ